jgi:hypothetical protein
VADGKGPVGRGLPVGKVGVVGDSPSRRVNGEAEKNGGAMDFGRWQGAPVAVVASEWTCGSATERGG